MPPVKKPRSPRAQKKFNLYEVMDGVHLKFVAEITGPTGPEAHINAARQGIAQVGIPYVTLSDRNITQNTIEEAVERAPVFKLSGGKKPAAAKKAAAKTAAPKTPAAPKAAAPKGGKKAGGKAPAAPKAPPAPKAPQPPVPPAPAAAPAVPPPPARTNPFAD